MRKVELSAVTPPPTPLQGSHHKVIIYDDLKAISAQN